MNAWSTSISLQTLVFDVAIMGGLLLAATILRRFVGFFQRYLIPNSLIAGFLGLLIGPEVLNWAGFSLARMEVYVYHLLAILFIGMGLRGVEKRSRGSVGFGYMAIACYLVQAIIGISLAFSLVYTIRPDLSPAVGLLLPLGFGMGPGLALTIGQSWEGFGVEGAGSVGLTIAAMGFLAAYLGGVVVVNRGLRRGASTLVGDEDLLSSEVRTGIIRSDTPPCGARLTFHTGAVEPLSIHIGLIGVVYLLTYGFVIGMADVFPKIGLEKEAVLLYSFHFLWANILALMVRKGMDGLKMGFVIDKGLLNRINGTLTDLMIVASIMAISLSVARAYALPILLITVFGAGATFLLLRFLTPRVFRDFVFERFVGVFGWMTGTLSSGLALLRVTDPEFRTTVAQDLALGSGVALVLGFPLLLVINLPFTFFDGRPAGFWVVVGVCALYLLILILAGLVIQRRRDRIEA